MNNECNKLEALKQTTSPFPDVGFNTTDLANRSLRLQGALIAKEIMHQAAECAAEILWPTRCALCDRPGSVLCPQCESSLHFIDTWQACPRCGAPFGRAVCTECNPVALKRMARDSLPFVGCVSATEFNDESGRIVRTYKDQGERRLAADMARIIARMIPPEWPIDAVTFVPASIEAIRRRDFDHGLLLAEHLAKQLGRPLLHTLESPRTKDQRELSRKERSRNLAGSFRVKPCARETVLLAPKLLLVDDVFTTGATLCSATDALLQTGFEEVRCASFARVY